MNTVHRRDGGSNYKAGYNAGFPRYCIWLFLFLYRTMRSVSAAGPLFHTSILIRRLTGFHVNAVSALHGVFFLLAEDSDEKRSA